MELFLRALEKEVYSFLPDLQLNVVEEVYFVEVQTMRTIAYNSKN